MTQLANLIHRSQTPTFSRQNQGREDRAHSRAHFYLRCSEHQIHKPELPSSAREGFLSHSPRARLGLGSDMWALGGWMPCWAAVYLKSPSTQSSRPAHQEYLLDLALPAASHTHRHTFVTQLPGTDVGVIHGTAVLHVTRTDQTLISPGLLPIMESTQTEPRANNTDFCRGSSQTSLLILHPCGVFKEV